MRKIIEILGDFCNCVANKDKLAAKQAIDALSLHMNEYDISSAEALIAEKLKSKIYKSLNNKNIIEFNEDSFIIFRGKKYSIESYLQKLLKYLYDKKIASYSEIEKNLGIGEKSVIKYMNLIRRRIKGLPIKTIRGFGYSYME